MRGQLKAGVLAVGLVAGLCAGAAPAADPKGGPWLRDYAAARREARQSGKPIFLVFR